jgi:hypothetical protein
MLLGEQFGGRHQHHLQVIGHRDDGGQQRDDRLAGADVALQQPVHRRGLLQVLDDLPQRHLLARREREWQHLPREVADGVSHHDAVRLGRHHDLGTLLRHGQLEQHELLENQPHLRRRAEGVQIVDAGAFRREVRVEQRLAP